MWKWTYGRTDGLALKTENLLFLKVLPILFKRGTEKKNNVDILIREDTRSFRANVIWL